MYHETISVALPPKESRVLQRSGKATYVYYFTERKWDPVRKRTVDNRVAVGKLCDDGESMWPNDRWRSISDDLEEPPRVAKYRNCGVFLGLRAALERIGALGALRAELPALERKLLAVVTYVVDDQQASAQGFPYWAYHNHCGFAEPFSDTTVSTLYSDLYEDDHGRDGFYSSFHEAYMEAVPHEEGLVVALDGTNHLCRSKGNTYREHGHSKAGKKGVAQVNTALMADEMTGIPLYTEEFCGSVLDMTETPETMERVRSLGFEKMVVAVDSGYATAGCATALSRDGFEFTVMTPSDYNVYKAAMAKHSKDVTREEHYIASQRCYGIAIRDVECLGGTYDVHLFYDRERAQEEVDSIHGKVEALLAKANERVRYTERFRETYAPHVIVTKVPKDPVTGKTYKAEIDADVVQAEVDEAGYFCVIASRGHDPEFVLTTQRLRDRAEKAFRRYNSSLGLLASGTHWTRTHVGKSFMGFLALVASESLRWYARDFLTGHETCQTLLGELRKIQVWKGPDGTGKLACGLTKKQKEIFECLGMDEAAIRKAVAELEL